MQIPALSRQMIAQALGGLTPVMLVSLKSDLSRTVNSGVAGTRALAAAWQAAGTQRLCDLQSKVPRVSIKLGKVLPRLPNVRLSAEEKSVIRAIIQLYLGWLLQLIARLDRPRRPAGSFQRLDRPHRFVLPLRRSHRTRIGVFLPPLLTTL